MFAFLTLSEAMGHDQWVVLLCLLFIGELQGKSESFPHDFESAKSDETQAYGYQLMPQDQVPTPQPEVLHYRQHYAAVPLVNQRLQMSHTNPRDNPPLPSREMNPQPNVSAGQQNLHSRGPNYPQRLKVKSSNYQQKFRNHMPSNYQNPQADGRYQNPQADGRYQNPQADGRYQNLPSHHEKLSIHESSNHERLQAQKPEIQLPSHQKKPLTPKPINYPRHDAPRHYQKPESQVQRYQGSSLPQASYPYQRTQPQAPSHFQKPQHPKPEPQLTTNQQRSQPKVQNPFQRVHPQVPSQYSRPESQASRQPRPQDMRGEPQKLSYQKRTQPQTLSHYQKPESHGVGHRQKPHYQALAHRLRPQPPKPDAVYQQPQFQRPEPQGQGYQHKSQFRAHGHQPLPETHSFELMSQKEMQPKAASQHQKPQSQKAVPSYQQKPQFQVSSHRGRTSQQSPMPQAPNHFRQHQPQRSEPLEMGPSQYSRHQVLNYQQGPKPQGINDNHQSRPNQRSQGSSYQQHYLPHRPQSNGYEQNPSLQVPVNKQRRQPHRSDVLPKPLEPNPQVWEQQHHSDGKFYSSHPAEGRLGVLQG